MNNTRKEKLTKAFQDGYDHCRDNGLFSRRLRIAASVRDFWEAGYTKAEREIEAERIAYECSPEGQAALKKAEDEARDMDKAMALINAGEYDAARSIMNKLIGI